MYGKPSLLLLLKVIQQYTISASTLKPLHPLRSLQPHCPHQHPPFCPAALSQRGWGPTAGPCCPITERLGPHSRTLLPYHREAGAPQQDPAALSQRGWGPTAGPCCPIRERQGPYSRTLLPYQREAGATHLLTLTLTQAHGVSPTSTPYLNLFSLREEGGRGEGGEGGGEGSGRGRRRRREGGDGVEGRGAVMENGGFGRRYMR